MFSEEYLAFLDETGDHSLQHIDKQYPIFALGAIFCETETYINEINPIFDSLKYTFWQKRNVILHSTSIRSSENDFSILRNKNTRNAFISKLNEAILKSNFQLVISAIDKYDHNLRYFDPKNPYDLTLEFIMERAFFLIGKPHHNKKRCLFIAESRDYMDNKRLLQTFHKIKENGTDYVKPEELEFITDLIFIKKAENETGHQIVDLCLYPTARTLISGKVHPSMGVVYKKLYKRLNGNPNGYGLKYFPYEVSQELIENIKNLSSQIDEEALLI